MKLSYAVVFERTPNNFAAYAPDIPGCISTHKTWDGIQAMIREAIEFHIEGMRLDGDAVPSPTMSVQQALAFHRAQPNDYGGYFPAPAPSDQIEDPYAVLEIEVDVNLDPAATASST